jgi:hypothetical protein
MFGERLQNGVVSQVLLLPSKGALSLAGCTKKPVITTDFALDVVFRMNPFSCSRFMASQSKDFHAR